MRRALLATGLLTLAALWLGPLPELARGSFSAHMTMHMGVVALAAPLIALGVAGGPFDPARLAPGLFAPVPASLVELAAVWGWHAPLPHGAARCGPAALAAEQATFLAAGLVLWIAVFGGGHPASGRPPSRTAAGVVAVLLTSMHMTFLGALLALTPRPLYAAGSEAEFTAGGITAQATGAADDLCRAPDETVRLFGLTPLEDQHLGGAIMILLGGASYLLGGLGLTAGLLRDVPTSPLPSGRNA